MHSRSPYIMLAALGLVSSLTSACKHQSVSTVRDEPGVAAPPSSGAPAAATFDTSTSTVAELLARNPELAAAIPADGKGLADDGSSVALPSSIADVALVAVDVSGYDTSIKVQNATDCQTYSTIAGMENMARQSPGLSLDLSEATVWQNSGNSLYVSVAMQTASQWVPEENGGVRFARIVGHDRIADTYNKVLNDATALALGTRVAQSLAAGEAVVIATQMNASALASQGTGYVNPKASFVGGIGHGMLVVGVAPTDAAGFGGGYYKIKNSWGSGYRNGGYAFLPFSYCTSAAAAGFFCAFDAISKVETYQPPAE